MGQDLNKLRDPALLVPHIRTRLQRGGEGNNGLWGIAIAYIDARGAASILDDALGPDGWSFEHTTPIKGKAGWLVEGKLTLYIERDGGTVAEVYRTDIGTGAAANGESDLENGAKGCISDCLKRCAAQAGVGRLVYRLPEVRLSGRDLYKSSRGKVMLSDEGAERVVAQYRQQMKAWADAYKQRGAHAGAEPEAPATEAAAAEADVDDTTPAPAAAPAPAPVESPAAAAVADENGEVTLDALAGRLAAPGEGTGWGQRWAWLMSECDSDESIAMSVLAAAGVPQKKAQLGDDGNWTAVLAHLAAKLDWPDRKAA